MPSDRANTSLRRTPRFAVELIAISAGVFLGLAADAAWDTKKDRAREADYLTELHGEMLVVREELAEDHRRVDRWFATSDSILIELQARTVPDAALNVWIQGIGMSIARFFPPSSVLTDLVSSGSLGLLRSDDLRFALLEYQQRRERVRFLEDDERSANESGLRPYLAQHFTWVDFSGDPITTNRPVVVRHDRWRSMLADPLFRNLVAIKRQRLGRVRGRYAELLRDVDELILLIERDIEG